MMTPEEIGVVNMLADSYNAFCALPREHPMEVAEFAHHIHALQHLTGSRTAWRQLHGKWETVGHGVLVLDASP